MPVRIIFRLTIAWQAVVELLMPLHTAAVARYAFEDFDPQRNNQLCPITPTSPITLDGHRQDTIAQREILTRVGRR